MFCFRNFKISEKFPILNKTLENEVKQESDTKDNEIEEKILYFIIEALSQCYSAPKILTFCLTHLSHLS